MRVEIKDRETLSSVSPDLASHYLRSKGWTRTRHEPDRFSVWRRAEPAGEVLVPLNRAFDDFAQRIAELLSDLQRIEERSEFEILRDINAAGSDIFRFRNQPFTPLAGTIQLEAGVRFVAAVRDMLLSGATSERDPNRGATAGRWTDEVSEFMRQALLGQTEIGSFVVTAQVPIQAPLGPDLFPDEVPPRMEPFERRAGIRMMSILAHAQSAAVRALEVDTLDGFRGLARGPSLQMMAALVDAQEVTPTAPLEVSAAWAPSRPLLGERPAPVVRFEPELIDPIRRVVIAARDVEPIPGANLVGPVQYLERTPQQPLIGDLAITTTIGGRTRKVYFSLEQPLYNEVIEAFQREWLIGVTGELDKAGKFWVLRNVRELRIFKREDASDETRQEEL